MIITTNDNWKGCLLINFFYLPKIKDSCVSARINKIKNFKYNNMDKFYTYYLMSILLEPGLSLFMRAGTQLYFILIVLANINL